MENKKFKILLVDDDEGIRITYADIFRNEGFDVVEAVDGLEGLNMAVKELPHLVFTGIIMPNMDGFGLKDALSKNVATSNIPVVASSHLGREEDRKKASEMGFRDFIVQGMLTPREVTGRIRSLLEPTSYLLRIDVDELDASRLARDLKIKENFRCPKCGETLSLQLRKIDIDNKKEFVGKMECPNCGEIS